MTPYPKDPVWPVTDPMAMTGSPSALGKLQFDDCMCFIDFKLCFFDGIIHTIMNIESRFILISYTVSPHIAFVSKY